MSGFNSLLFWLFQIVFTAALCLATALPQRRAPLQPDEEQQDQQQAEQNYNNYQPQQEYRQAKAIDDFRPKNSLETTTVIPIIFFDKEQGNDGSYKTS